MNVQFMQGNRACALGALAAGCRFYAGYPITPSSEIAEILSRELPKVGGKFIQMEDEIASMAAIIGASIGGLKAMTATSGPGFSLMQENIGYAVATEIPCVVANVMRTGPSTGLPTDPAQGDVMQARWGTHGDHPIIALYPAFSEELFSETVRAFNLAEKYWNPVILLSDEVLAKAHMDVEIPEPGSYEVYWEKTHPISDLNIYDRKIGESPPRIDFFHGYPIHIDGLEHDAHGWPSFDAKTVDKMQKLRMQKIYQNLGDIIKFKEHFLDDAEVLVFSYGISARSALAAVKMAREQGVKAGLFQALTVWPFPRAALQERFKKTRKVLTVEMNMGQMKYEVERIAPPGVETQTLLRANGMPFSPDEVLNAIKEFAK
jgi:2-oxoglutarate/2-oxoacid ferredoxin oxidoreductase subunit alpha